MVTIRITSVGMPLGNTEACTRRGHNLRFALEIAGDYTPTPELCQHRVLTLSKLVRNVAFFGFGPCCFFLIGLAWSDHEAQLAGKIRFRKAQIRAD